jgi:hypothetical protein
MYHVDFQLEGIHDTRDMTDRDLLCDDSYRSESNYFDMLDIGDDTLDLDRTCLEVDCAHLVHGTCIAAAVAFENWYSRDTASPCMAPKVVSLSHVCRYHVRKCQHGSAPETVMVVLLLTFVQPR